MKLVRRFLLATAGLLAMGGSAFAADVVIIPPAAPPPPVPVIAPAFAGPYWGVFGGYGMSLDLGVGSPVVGTQFGYNFGSGNLRFGFEVETETFQPAVLFPFPLFDATLNGRAGVVVNNRVFIYGQAGIGTLIPTEDNRNVVSMFLGASAPQPPAPGSLFGPGCRVGASASS